MYYHCKILKKLSEKDHLIKSKVSLDTIRLHQMTDFVNYLRFELFKITALTQFLKLTDLIIVRENKKPVIIINSLEKIRKDRYKMSYTQNYKENHKFLFIIHLYDNRNKQFKGITFYFRLRFMYLRFYEMLNIFNL